MSQPVSVPQPRRKISARTLAVTAMLSAVAAALMYIEIPIPVLIPSFVKLDVSDLPALLGSFSLGPVASIVIAIYKFHKNRTGAILGSLAGAVAMGLFSVPLNYFLVYPAYAAAFGGMELIVGAYQTILPSVNGLLECLLIFNLPFTIVKGLLCAAICFLIYKPLSPLLHGRKD